MWPQCLLVFSVLLSAAVAIKVAVDNPDVEASDIIPIETVDDNIKTPVYYLPNDESSNSFLIPPHQLEEIEVSPPTNTPATYLLPPAPGKHIDYYVTAQPEEPEQTDWYPIASDNKKQEAQTQEQTDDARDVTENNRNGKVLKESHINSLPSRSLVPPTANAQNDFIILAPSQDLELPHESIDQPTTLHEMPNEVYSKIRPHTVHPKISLVPYLMPPKLPSKYYNPTKLYPKKFVNEFKPIPIPINQYGDESIDKVPMARPAKPFIPIVNVDGQYDIPRDKQVYLYQKAENQRKLQSETEKIEQPQHTVPVSEDDPPREQEASESNLGHPGRNIYSAPLKQASPAPAAKYGSKNGERTEFRMHGMKGPHSYQFGYDTGKGKNRQFRYEERDNDGHVKGHYGYMDKHGKLRVVNYDADPEHGFRAEAPVEKE